MDSGHRYGSALYRAFAQLCDRLVCLVQGQGGDNGADICLHCHFEKTGNIFITMVSAVVQERGGGLWQDLNHYTCPMAFEQNWLAGQISLAA
jgi:hypothetical protein